MNRAGLLRTRVGFALGALCLTAVGVVLSGGCAQGTDGFGEPGGTSSGGDGGSGGDDTATSTTSSGPGTGGEGGAPTSTTSTSSGMGGQGAGSPCGPQEHQCGGICVGNTPTTGCASSTTCNACTPPANGTAVCTTDGLCDFQCTAPYQKNGGTCQCTSQCCSNTDCSGGLACVGGSCVCQTQCCNDAMCSNPTTACSGGTCACDANRCFTYCLGMNQVGVCFPIIGCQCSS